MRLSAKNKVFLWVLLIIYLLFSAYPVQSAVAQGVMIDGGRDHSIMLQDDGTAWIWGGNNYGQLGNGTLKGSCVPASLDDMNVGNSVAAGGMHTLVLKNDGTVWAWGRNDDGQLGNGTFTTSLEPVKVLRGESSSSDSYLKNVEAVAAGLYHSVARTGNKTVYSWGDNSCGQLGNGSNDNSNIPVFSLSGVKQVAAGSYHTIAFLDNGNVRTWGSNEHGQLGATDVSESSNPLAVQGLENVIMVTAGERHSVALTANKTVYTWGDNTYGQLGTGDLPQSNQPVQVEGLENIVCIAAGSWHTVALDEDGKVYTWGYNLQGQLGDGSNDDRSLPVPAQTAGSADLQEVQTVGAGGFHSFAIKNDGTVWAWGKNLSGQLGDGSKVNRNYAVQSLYEPAIDPTPPQFSSNYPKIPVDEITGTSFKLLVKIDKPGRAYYVVLPGGAPAPTSLQVLAGEDGSGLNVADNLKGNIVLSAHVEGSAQISGLSADNHYDIYIVAEDYGNNYQPEPCKLSAYTAVAVEDLSVLYTIPENQATAVSPETNIKVTFNRNIAPGSAYDGITLENSGEQVEITKSIDDNVLTLTPPRLAHNTVYTVTLPANSLQDMQGEELGKQSVFSFTTKAYLQIEQIYPAEGEENVPIDTVIEVDFDETIMPGPEFAEIILVDAYDNRIPLDVTLEERKLLLTPTQQLADHTVYTVTVPAAAVQGPGLNYISGILQFSFTNRSLTDTTPPCIITTDPDAAIGWYLPIEGSFIVTLSEKVQPGPYFGNIRMLDPGGGVIPITRNISGDTLTVQPSCTLGYGKTYTVNIPAGAIRDLTGNLLQETSPFDLATRVLGVESHDPCDKATGVLGSQVISITFNRAVLEGPAFDSISLWNETFEEETPLSEVKFEGKKLLLIPEDPLSTANTEYKVYLPYNAVKIIDEAWIEVWDPVEQKWFIDLVNDDIYLENDLSFVFTTIETQNITLEIEDVYAVAGQEISVPLTISNNSPLAGFQFDIAYDPEILTLSDPAVSKGELIAYNTDWTVSSSVYAASTNENQLRVLGYNTQAQELTQNHGELLKLNFSINNDITAKETQITFLYEPGNEVEDLLLLNKDGASILGAGQDIIPLQGTVNIRSCIKGDVNADGNINILDVIRTVNIALGKIIPSSEELWASDTNNDGRVNVVDVITILNNALGKV